MKHNWEYKKLGEVCEILYGYPFESAKFNTESKGIPLIRIRDVMQGKTSTYYDGERLDTYIIRKGDLLIGMDGEFNIAKWKSEDALLNQRVCRITSNQTNLLLSNFLFYFLKEELKRIEEKTSYVTVKHLSAKVLNAILIPLPPLPIQEQIVAELDKINEVIEDCRELLSNLDALAQSLFYDTFGDPIENDKGWEKASLDSICNIVGRIGFRGYTRQDLVEKGEGAITLSPSNIRNGLMDYNNCSYISWYKYNESPEIKIKNGDIIFTKTGSTVGKVGIAFNLPEKATINPQLVVFKNLSQNNWYVSFVLRDSGYQIIIKEKAGGSAVPTMSQKVIGNLPIPLPPLSLQNRFASQIEAIEKRKKEVEETIKELQTLLDSRMDYWFN